MAYRPSIRRSQIIQRIALMGVCAVTLVVIGGLWWLVERQSPAAGLDTPDPPVLMVAGPAATLRPTQARPEALLAPTPIIPAAIAEPAITLPSTPAIEKIQTPAPRIGRPAAPGPMFDNRPIRPVGTIRMLVTAYSPDARSCGKFADGITASGYSVYTNGMKLVAADTKLLPFGSIITVPGYNDGLPVPVLDRGGKIKGKRLDVLYPTHEIALQWGAQWLDVVVWEYAD